MTGNIAPAELATISTPWASYAEADDFKREYLRLLPLLHFTYSAINPVAVKSLMKALGMPAGDLRKPLTGLDAEALGKGLRVVADLGLDKAYGYKLKALFGRGGLTREVDLGIRGKNALVCGASRGLGKACAFALAREDMNLNILCPYPRRARAYGCRNCAVDRRKSCRRRRRPDDAYRPRGRGRRLCSGPISW